MWEQNVSSGLGASPIDVRAVACGYVLNIPVVTDDKDMQQLGLDFGVEMLSLIDLLELMYDCGHIKKSTISSLIQHLVYDNDLPYPAFVSECEGRWS